MCLSALGSGCGDRAPEHDALTGFIVEGDAAAGFPYEAIGSVHVGANRSLSCSGTLITTNTFLTAAHCVAQVPTEQLSVQFTLSSNNAPDSAFVPVVSKIVHPDYTGRSVIADLALLRLAWTIDNIAAIPALPESLGFGQSEVGVLVLDIVGYGLDENGLAGSRNHTEVMLGSIGCAIGGCPSEFSSDARLVAYGQPNGGPCALDSGGPGIVVRGAQHYVGAISVTGDSQCRVWGASVSVPLFADWIAANSGGTPPVDAGVPDASVPDASVPDASVPDAGVPDASVPDAGTPDAGTGDGGTSVMDSGLPTSDGGVQFKNDVLSGGCSLAQDAAPTANHAWVTLALCVLLVRRRLT